MRSAPPKPGKHRKVRGLGELPATSIFLFAPKYGYTRGGARGYLLLDVCNIHRTRLATLLLGNLRPFLTSL
jgi:hypothetical protein